MGAAIDEDIGQMGGAIWYALNTHGEISLAQLKKLVEGKTLISIGPSGGCRARARS